MAIISKICPWQLSNATFPPWGVQWQPYATHGKHLSKLRRKKSEPLEVPAAGDTASCFKHLEIWKRMAKAIKLSLRFNF
jgi:hypothetical protein